MYANFILESRGLLNCNSSVSHKLNRKKLRLVQNLSIDKKLKRSKEVVLTLSMDSIGCAGVDKFCLNFLALLGF